MAAMLMDENERFLIARPPAIVPCSIVYICVPRDWLQTTYRDLTQ